MNNGEAWGTGEGLSGDVFPRWVAGGLEGDVGRCAGVSTADNVRRMREERGLERQREAKRCSGELSPSGL